MWSHSSISTEEITWSNKTPTTCSSVTMMFTTSACHCWRIEIALLVFSTFQQIQYSISKNMYSTIIFILYPLTHHLNICPLIFLARASLLGLSLEKFKHVGSSMMSVALNSYLVLIVGKILLNRSCISQLQNINVFPEQKIISNQLWRNVKFKAMAYNFFVTS